MLRNLKNQERIGRLRKLSKSYSKFLRVYSLRDRRKSSKDLAQHLAASSGCQDSTVQRSLIRNGLCGRVAAKKPFSRKGNKVKRQRYAKAHKDWNEDQWKRVLWRKFFWNFWVPSLTICEKNRWNWWNMVEGPGLGLNFCQWCWRYCLNWWDHECWKVRTGFNSPCHSVWKAPDWEWFSMITIPSTLLMQWNNFWRKPLKNSDSHWLASTESRPEYYRGSMGSPEQRKK